MIWVIVNIHHSDELLPFFIRYYKKRGADKILILRHEPIYNIVDDDVIQQEVNEPYVSGYRDNELLVHFKNIYLSKDDWYIPADLDEFHYFPGLRDFRNLTGPWDFVPSRFLDRLPVDGKIKPISLDKTLDEQFPLAGFFTEKICGGCTSKVALARATVDTNSGHHWCSNSGHTSWFSLQTHHFKWGGKKFWEFVRHKDASYGRDFYEISRFIHHYTAFGRLNIYRSDIGLAPKIGI